MKNHKAMQEVYVAELQVEELFRFSPKFGVLVDSEEKYLPVIDAKSYEMVIDYLIEHFRFQARKNHINIASRLAVTQTSPSCAKSTPSATTPSATSPPCLFPGASSRLTEGTFSPSSAQNTEVIGLL